VVVKTLDEPFVPRPVSGDDDRTVDLSEELVVLPEQTVDDTDRGWGERAGTNDQRLLDERPPHWS
jgi:hypothetical protein